MKNLNKGIFTIAATIVFSMTTQAQTVNGNRFNINRLSGGGFQGVITMENNSLSIRGGSDAAFNAPSVVARKITLWAEAGANLKGSLVISDNQTDRIPTGMKLYVKGTIGCKGKVTSQDFSVATATAFPDYVFANDYKVPTLSETEAYIKANKHLQAFKSAKELEENGYSVIDMDRSLLQTVEEMTLHAIAQEKEITTLKSEMAAIKALLLKK